MALAFAARFKNVAKIYRGGLLRRRHVHALRGISLDVPVGEVLGLVGPNRAGKTTLVKILLSVCRPTSGEVERLGLPWRSRATLSQVGYLHDAQAFPRYLTATQLLNFYGALSWVPSAELRRRVPALLEQVGLADRASEPVANFSKGMGQRLALAQALINDPDLLVLDEPTEGMDLLARRLLHDTIRRRKQNNQTTMLVSHSMADVEQLCDRVAVLRQGQLVRHAASAEWHGSDDGSAVPLEDWLQPAYEEALA
ncbi:MAG: ABC transporter ATP-binding protein [Pirellulales bacterium]